MAQLYYTTFNIRSKKYRPLPTHNKKPSQTNYDPQQPTKKAVGGSGGAACGPPAGTGTFFALPSFSCYHFFYHFFPPQALINPLDSPNQIHQVQNSQTAKQPKLIQPPQTQPQPPQLPYPRQPYPRQPYPPQPLNAPK
ncbi:hypothetical protein DICA1_A07800 [Diutina catenulata]